MTWPTELLGQLDAELQTGFACKPSNGDSGFAQLRTNNVSTDGGIDLSAVKKVPATAEQVRTYSLRSGDVLFNNTNSPALVGKTAFFEESGEYLFSNHMTRIRVYDRRVDPQFLARFLHWNWQTGRLRALMTQWVNQAAINKTELERVQVPLPPLPQQRRIVKILDEADRLRMLRAEADAKAERILPALFIKMFGDPDTNPIGWERRLLGDISDIRRGASPRPIDQFMGGTVPWIKIGDATGSNAIFIERTADFVTEEGAARSVRVQPGALLVANSGVSCGFARLTRTEGCIHDGWLSIENLPDELPPLFVAYFINLRTKYLRSIAPGGTQPNLNTDLLRRFAVPVPEPALVTRFLENAGELRRLESISERATGNLTDLFRVLQTRAFSGELQTAGHAGGNG